MRRRNVGMVIGSVMLAIAGAGCVACDTVGVAGGGGGGGGATGGRLADDPQIASLVENVTRDRLVPFTSDPHFREYVDKLIEAQRRLERRRAEESASDTAAAPSAVAAEAAPAEGSAGQEESITNTQEANVDEGGIVKTHGDHLVVLRRGRLFTVRIGDDALVPASTIDAFPAGGGDAWYDEMLVSGDTVVVIGYSYRATATEFGVFDIDREGRLSHRQTYYLRSNDYYSSRNYASRLVGTKLVFYMPYSFLRWSYAAGNASFGAELPGVRPWNQDGWNEVIDGTHIYQPVQPTMHPTMHTVVTCDLATRDFRCNATAVLGPWARTFYVSGSAVYLWVTNEGTPFATAEDRKEQPTAPAVVYRMPLDGSAPGALRVWGAPIDQLSFKESDDHHLNVVVQAEGGGDAMWSPEITSGDLALARIPLDTIDARVGEIGPDRYTRLARPTGPAYTLQNRYVGDYVLYGTGNSWGHAADGRDGRVFVHPWRHPGETSSLAIPHSVDRIEAMGADAVVVGSDGSNLMFSSVRLDGGPAIVDRYTIEHASQGETRTHGFFYKPSSEGQGVLGLPVRRGRSAGYHQLTQGSAEIVYLRVQDRRFTRLGALEARSERAVDDQCKASCVDWYGNARPIFWRGRVFALMGYELVEATLDGDRMFELRRTDFAPGRALR